MTLTGHNQRTSLGVAVLGVVALVLLVVALFYSFGAPARVQAMQAQLQSAQSELGALRLRAASLQEENQRLRQRLQAAEETAAEEQAGLASGRLLPGPVSGPGLIIELSEPPPAGTEEYQAARVVHAADLLELTNALAAAGARAIAVNGLRVALLGSIQCEGPRLLIGGKPLRPPYRVEVIGDPTKLARELRRTGGLAERLHNFGIKVTSRPAARLSLPPLSMAAPASSLNPSGRASEESP